MNALVAQQPVSLTPMDILNDAIEKGRPLEVLEKLMDMQERWERNNARKAFDEALAAAKAEIPVIVKNRQVGFDSKKVGAARTDYRHEDLAEIARTVDPILGKHGLSYRFRTTSAVNEPISVTCIVSHRLGHSEENTLCGPRDDSGNKNSIQAIGSTLTYLQRYTLKAALGLAASNDDDGKSVPSDEPSITQEQANGLITTCNEKRREPAALVDYINKRFKLQIEAIHELPAKHFDEVAALLKNAASA